MTLFGIPAKGLGDLVLGLVWLGILVHLRWRKQEPEGHPLLPWFMLMTMALGKTWEGTTVLVRHFCGKDAISFAWENRVGVLLLLVGIGCMVVYLARESSLTRRRRLDRLAEAERGPRLVERKPGPRPPASANPRQAIGAEF